MACRLNALMKSQLLCGLSIWLFFPRHDFDCKCSFLRLGGRLAAMILNQEQRNLLAACQGHRNYLLPGNHSARSIGPDEGC